MQKIFNNLIELIGNTPLLKLKGFSRGLETDIIGNVLPPVENQKLKEGDRLELVCFVGGG